MTVYTPKSMSDLTNYILNQQIEKTIELANEKLNDIVLQCFKDHMDEDFYNKYKSKSKAYPRSNQMRDNIGIKLEPIRSGNNVTFGVYFDESKLDESYWSNKGYEGIRYNENGYTPEMIVSDILTGNFDDNRTKDILEEVKNDAEMLVNIKSSLLDMFIKNGFTLK